MSREKKQSITKQPENNYNLLPQSYPELDIITQNTDQAYVTFTAPPPYSEEPQKFITLLTQESPIFEKIQFTSNNKKIEAKFPLFDEAMQEFFKPDFARNLVQWDTEGFRKGLLPHKPISLALISSVKDMQVMYKAYTNILPLDLSCKLLTLYQEISLQTLAASKDIPQIQAVRELEDTCISHEDGKVVFSLSDLRKTATGSLHWSQIHHYDSLIKDHNIAVGLDNDLLFRTSATNTEKSTNKQRQIFISSNIYSIIKSKQTSQATPEKQAPISNASMSNADRKILSLMETLRNIPHEEGTTKTVLSVDELKQMDPKFPYQKINAAQHLADQVRKDCGKTTSPIHERRGNGKDKASAIYIYTDQLILLKQQPLPLNLQQCKEVFRSPDKVTQHPDFANLIFHPIIQAIGHIVQNAEYELKISKGKQRIVFTQEVIRQKLEKTYPSKAAVNLCRNFNTDPAFKGFQILHEYEVKGEQDTRLCVDKSLANKICSAISNSSIIPPEKRNQAQISQQTEATNAHPIIQALQKLREDKEYKEIDKDIVFTLVQLKESGREALKHWGHKNTNTAANFTTVISKDPDLKAAGIRFSRKKSLGEGALTIKAKTFFRITKASEVTHEQPTKQQKQEETLQPEEETPQKEKARINAIIQTAKHILGQEQEAVFTLSQFRQAASDIKVELPYPNTRLAPGFVSSVNTECGQILLHKCEPEKSNAEKRIRVVKTEIELFENALNNSKPSTPKETIKKLLLEITYNIISEEGKNKAVFTLQQIKDAANKIGAEFPYPRMTKDKTFIEKVNKIFGKTILHQCMKNKIVYAVWISKEDLNNLKQEAEQPQLEQNAIQSMIELSSQNKKNPNNTSNEVAEGTNPPLDPSQLTPPNGTQVGQIAVTPEQEPGKSPTMHHL